jgi:putative membrane protein
MTHPGEPHPSFGEIMTWWSWKPAVAGLLAASVALYGVGLARLWRSAGAGHGVRRWSVAAFAAGTATLVIALLSPIDALSAARFSVHMSQHELLMVVAAPLIVLGKPLFVALWALPTPARAALSRAIGSAAFKRIWRVVTAPLVVLVVHALVLWIWHVPALFSAALDDETVHGVQHAMFFVAAALFWWGLVHGRYGRAGYGVSVLYVFATALHTSILGALLSVAGRLWYPSYATRGAALGVDPLEDQQLAGLIMWVPAGVILLVVGLALFAAWVGESERRALRGMGLPRRSA